MHRALSAVLAFVLLAAANAQALCLDGRRPTMRAEFSSSDVVATGSAGA